MARQGVFEGWSAANAAAFGWAQAPGARVVSGRRSQRCSRAERLHAVLVLVMTRNAISVDFGNDRSRKFMNSIGFARWGRLSGARP